MNILQELEDFVGLLQNNKKNNFFICLIIIANVYVNDNVIYILIVDLCLIHC